MCMLTYNSTKVKQTMCRLYCDTRTRTSRCSRDDPCLMAVPRTSTKNKRTPRGTVDDAQRAEEDEWEVDRISARRQKGLVVQYLVHWKGCKDFNTT